MASVNIISAGLGSGVGVSVLVGVDVSLGVGVAVGEGVKVGIGVYVGDGRVVGSTVGAAQASKAMSRIRARRNRLFMSPPKNIEDPKGFQNL